MNSTDLHIKAITVVMPSYNNGVEIHSAIQSIMNQGPIVRGELKVEIVIVNDASVQASKELLDTLPNLYPSVRLIHLEKNLGPAGARNAGIRTASHPIIGFLDGDDQWPENKLEWQLPYFADEDLSIVGGKIRYFTDKGAEMPDLQFEDGNQLAHVHLGAILVRKRVFEAGMIFDESLRYSEDVNWWMQVRERSLKILILEEVCLLYRIHPDNMTRNKTIHDLQLLKVLHLSLKRRRENTGESKEIPRLSSYRMQSVPQVDVLIPVHNGGKFIREAIGSVLGQTWPRKRIIVIDDGSSDDTASIVQALAREHREIIFVQQSKAGVNAALNRGLDLADAAFISFIDADDLWEKTKLEKQVTAMMADATLRYCFTQIKEFESFDTADKKRFHAREQVMNGCNRTTCLLRKDMVEEFGRFEENIVAGDFISWFSRVTEKGIRGTILPEVLAYRRVHDNNLTSRINRMDYLKVLKQHLELKRQREKQA